MIKKLLRAVALVFAVLAAAMLTAAAQDYSGGGSAQHLPYNSGYVPPKVNVPLYWANPVVFPYGATITGGSITAPFTIDTAVLSPVVTLRANNLSDLSSASAARTNLGLGSIATQAAGAVAVTGGAIDGTTIGSVTPADVAAFTLKLNSIAGTTNAPHGLDFTLSGGAPDVNQRVGPVWSVTNSASAPGLGQSRYYYSNNISGPNFDVGDEEVMYDLGTLTGATTPNYQSHWLVHVTPNTSSQTFTAVDEEINMVNRAGDYGVCIDVTTCVQLTGGMRFIPESQTFGPPGTGYNVNFGFHVGHSSSVNTLGKFVKSYNPFGIEFNGIAPGGTGYEVEGNNTGVTGDNPLTPLDIRGTFTNGIQTSAATFANSTVLTMNAGQLMSWTNGTATASMQGSCASTTCNIVVTPANGAFYSSTSSNLGAAANPWATIYDIAQHFATVTVATLPACVAGNADTLMAVSDATAPTYRGALTGGGTVHTPVYCDGASWTAH